MHIKEDPEPDYLALGPAMERGLVNVTEISESGAVSDLKVENKAELPVLLLDGEELAGAKQNRVVNTTILLREKSTTVIPVSCTEQGRWNYLTNEFVDSHTVMPPTVRQHKVRSVSRSLEMNMGHRADQQRVWQEVGSLAVRSGTKSHTGAMRDVHEHLADKLEDLCRDFSPHDDQKGLMVIVGDRVAGFDVLSRRDPFAALYPKLLRSYATDALLEAKQKECDHPIELAQEFMQTALLAFESRHEAIGLGLDCRFTGSTSIGSALLCDTTIVHMAFFRSDPDTKPETMSASRRRRNFRKER